MDNKIFETFKKIIPFIMAVISYNYIHSLFFEKTYSFFSSLLFIIIVLLFYKNDFKNKVLKKEIIITTIVFSFLYTYGYLVDDYMLSMNVNVFKELFNFKSIAVFFSIFNIYYILLNYIMPKIYKYKFKGDSFGKKYSFLIFTFSFITIILLWIPYTFTYYPGLVSNDSIDVINIITDDLKSLNNHHPIFYILFAYIPITIGTKCFNSLPTGVALYSLIQIFIMASIFAYTIVFINKKNVPKFVTVIVLLYYALLPVHAIYSTIMWKDVIFGGLLLLLTIETINFVELSKQKEIKFKNLIRFMIIALLCALFRNNAIYMFIILAICSFIIIKKHRKVIIKSFGLVIVLYFIITVPGYKIFNVKQTESAEYIAIPLQQIGRIVYKDVKLTKKEKALINDLMPIDTLKKAYYPVIVDNIKFNKEFNTKVFENNKFKYFGLWIKLCLKHPGVAIEAASASTLGYWYPNIEYWYVPTNGVSVNDKYNIKITPKTGKLITGVVINNLKKETSIYNIEWNFVIWFYTVIIFSIISVKKKGLISIIPYIPLYGIWFTLLIATPVYAEYRYIYGLFTSFPVLLIYPYLKK